MTPHLTPASGCEDNGFPSSRSALAAERPCDLGVRPGESDPARMLAGVLLLVIVIMIMALAWWLSA